MMTTFIAMMIAREADKSLEQGQDKYRAYFVNTRLYVKWQAEIDTILETDGYQDVIVSQ